MSKMYSDREYLEGKFANIEALIKPLVERVDEIEKAHQDFKGFIKGAKWVVVMLVGAITLGLVHLTLNADTIPPIHKQ